jgi:hypothetical protein
MKKGSIATLLAALALVLGLAACGGSDSGGDTTAADTTAEQTTESTETTPETTEQEGNATSSGELAPPGTQLKAGESANVIWVPFDEDDFDKEIKGIPITATVKAIEAGTADDLANIELDGAPEDSIPFYVRVEMEATGSKEPSPDEEPDIAFDAIDDRGQEQESVIFLGDFEPCEEEERPQPFTNGESYETCLTYLIAGGGSIKEVRWGDGPSAPNEVTDYFEDPVVWTK